MTCNWPVDRTVLPALPAVGTPTYAAALASRNAAEDLAVQVLWALSGRQYGLCESVARPCPQRSGPVWRNDRYGPYSPYALGGSFTSLYDETVAPYCSVYDAAAGGWVNYSCGCLGRCRQAGPRTAHLPGPVNEIVTVTIGAAVVSPSDYSLEGDVIYRRAQNWPSQDLNRPLGEDGTWSVKYLKGIPVPDGAAFFVGQLAKEFLAAVSGDNCRIPRNVVATTSRGVSRQFDPSRIYASGKTGLAEIDLWLSAVNPHHVFAAPKVR